MSSQPYVYKPPVRRTSQNPPSKSQILPQTTNPVKPQGLKVTKLSDLGSSSLFKGLDNMNVPVSQNKTRVIEQTVKEKKEEIKEGVKDRSISGLSRFQRRKPDQSIEEPKVTVRQPISRIKETEKANEKQSDIQSNPSRNAAIIRKPITRTGKEEQRESVINKPQVQTQQTKLEPQKDKLQTSAGYSYKPTIRRTSTPLNAQNSQTIPRNQSAILTKQPQISQIQQHKDNITTSKSNIYERKKQRESSIVDLNLQVNTKTKIFVIQPKNDSKISSSVQKIPTSQSIPSNNNINSPLKQPTEESKKEDISVTENTSIISQPKKYTYQRPKTKAQLVRENQLKARERQLQEDQKISESKIQQKKPVYGHNRSTIISKTEKEQKQIQNNSTLIGDKQLKSSPYQYGRKTKQQLVNQNKAKITQPQIIVSAQTFKTQEKKEEQEIKPKTTYSYQPAYKRTQKPTEESRISSQQEKNDEESTENNSKLLVQRKAQYPYQRKSITQQKTESQSNINVAIKPSPTPYSRTSKVQPKQEQQTQKQTKKDIPPIALSILSILLKKKLSSNSRQSFVKIKQFTEKSNKKQKYLQSLLKKSITLGLTYISNLQLQTFNLLKKNLISKLTEISTTSSTKIVASKIVSKPKESKQDQDLKNLNQTLKKPLCYQLSQLVNTKLRFVLKQKIYASFNMQVFQQKKSPIFTTLFKLFQTKAKTHLQSSFSKLKFSYAHVQKSNDEDLLPLFETRNKKLSKQEIIKHFQTIISTQPVLTPSKRVSLLEKTPQKIADSKLQGLKSKNQSKKSLIGSSLSKIESQKVTQIKSKIQSLEKQLKDKQKSHKDKQNEINQKKIELRRQIDELKKQNEMRKKENEELKEKLKRFEVISFSDRKEPQTSYDQHELITPTKQSSSLLSRQKSTGQNNEFLDILCQLYVSGILRNQEGSSMLNLSTMGEFLSYCQETSPLIVQSLNYMMKKVNSQEQLIRRDESQYRQNLTRSKVLIEERLLLEENILLKSQIEEIESKMIGESESTQQKDPLTKSTEQIEAIRSLVKNYIKQRYLWQWIKKSIQKI